MTNEVFLQIGALTLDIKSPCALSFRDTLPVYEAFLERMAHHDEAADVRVRLVLGSIPSTATLNRVFSGESWSMFQDTGFRYISRHPPVLDEPLCIAQFDPEVKHATIYCGPSLLDNNGASALLNPVRYPLDQLLVMYALAGRDGIIVHAAGATIAGKGFVFPGASSAGKSTLCAQLAGHPDIEILSDDRVILRQIDGEWRVFGTPWPGDAGIAVNKGVPLSAMLFLNHGQDNRIARVGPSQALERLLPVVSIPWYDAPMVPLLLSSCDALLMGIPAFELSFLPVPAVADFMVASASSF